MGRRVNVIGVGMTKFAKPGASEDYHVMATQGGARRARRTRRSPTTRSSRRTPATSTATARAASARSTRSGLTGIPVFNVNNNCSTGSTALMLGKQAVEGGIAECVLVVGFEKMEKGALGSKFTDRDEPARQARAA